MGKIGDFTVAYMGYGGIGGIGNKRIVAIKELEVNEGAGFNLDLKLACPK